MKGNCSLAAGLIACAVFTTSAHAAQTDKPATAMASSEDGDVGATSEVVTRHVGVFHGRKVAYTATAGRLPVTGPDGGVDSQMFYVAYNKEGVAPGSRPITFLVNGGPGSATAWLHLGGIGPRKIVLNQDGSTPPSPVRLIDNAESALDRTDLVFIDAPGTGFSRLAGEAAKGRLLTKQGDLDAFATFIQNYLRQNDRFGSALYLFGESYGGFRMAGLTDVLVRRGVPVKGVVLLSAMVDFVTIDADMANDLPYVLAMPSYASIAAYHHNLPPGSADGNILRTEVENWAINVYQPALAKGTGLSDGERQRIIEGLVRYTGLSSQVVTQLNLRIDVLAFMKYANMNKGTTGRVDGRMTGPAPAGQVEEPAYDPAMGSLTPAFASAASQYLFDELKVTLGLPYRMYSREIAERFEIAPAIKGFGNQEYASTLDGLQSTVVKNKDFRILSIQGMYDLACPYFSMKYSLDHMGLPPEYQRNVQQLLVPAGHMAYVDRTALHEMSDAIVRFIDQGGPPPTQTSR
jgi:carboxypeptidase C (cathepsin A)